MTVLGIDSAAQEASVALVEDGAVVCEERHTPLNSNGPGSGKRPNNHTEILLPLIDIVLARSRTSIEQLSGISVSLGPGSFTGLRVGLATAKGLAYASGIPLVGVSTLLANAGRAGGTNALVASMLDARRGEIYGALFRVAAGKLARISADALLTVNAMIELLHAHCAAASETLLLIGEGARAYETRWIDAFATARIVTDPETSLGAEVAKLGIEQLRTTGRETGNLTPVYLRAAAAESKIATT
jgi:tRNA threonylcarbamoyladenosine biosynthesis protein TsaB